MSADSLLAEYQRWLLGGSAQDEAAAFTDAKLINKVRQSILEEPELHNVLQNDVFSLVASGLRDQTDLLSTLNRMADAFQTLEQAALHLYFTPWRKEFHNIKSILEEPQLHNVLQNDVFSLVLRDQTDLLSTLNRMADAFQTLEQSALHLYFTPWRKEFHNIKTFSGHYVHKLEVAFSQDGIFLALGKLGYEPQEGGTFLSLRVLPSEQALSMAALGFLAAQLECHILADIVQCSGLVNGADLIQERKTWRGEAACMERLQKLIQEAAQVPKSPPNMGVYKNQVFNGDDELYRPKFCDRCHETWDQHVNGRCREKTERPVHKEAPGFGLPVDYDLHDCVYADNSLEQCCGKCHLLHSSSCPVLSKCKHLVHPVTQLTPLKKREAVMEEVGKKYQLHICLQPGQLPHYRCSQCKELHYINCKRLEQCRSKNHSAKMIMLEKDQQLWLRRSLMDLTQLCIDRGSEV